MLADCRVYSTDWTVLSKVSRNLVGGRVTQIVSSTLTAKWKACRVRNVSFLTSLRKNGKVNEPHRDKTNKMSVRPAKTQISLGIRPVWSKSSLCAQWVAKDPSFLHANSEDSDKTGRMPRLIWVFAGRTLIVLFCHVAAQMRIIAIWQLSPKDYVFSINEPRHEKTCLSHMRTTKVQTSLCIRLVCSAPLLFVT